MLPPEAYVIQKFLSTAHTPTYNRHSKTYIAGCPVCKEGKSFGKKKRLHFYTKTLSFYCFNCNRSWTAYAWLKEACRLSYKEIQQDILSSNYRVDITNRLFSKDVVKPSSSLPYDSIDLFNQAQIEHYKNNNIIQNALNTINLRRLNTAINRPKHLYISLTDFTHKNRLCIPFYNLRDEVVFFQSRSLDGTLPKYLSKSNAEKSFYGLNNISSSLDYIFIFEGPIDAMFVQNGIAATGLTLTAAQQATLASYPFHKKIWVLDNQERDIAAKKKTDELIKTKSSVFVWPKNIPCKDFNELAVLLKQDSISHKFILKNTRIF